MPRAPGGRAKEEPPPQGGGRTMLLLVVLVIVLVGAGGTYWYTSTHNSQTRAETTRDSLRALAAAPEGPDTTLYAAPNDFGPIRRARALRVSLINVLRDNRQAVLGFPEGPIDTTVTDRAAKRRAMQYVAFHKRWNDRLDLLTRGGTEFLYAPGVRYTEQMQSVTNQLKAALSVARDMVRPLNVKARAERVADFSAANGYLNSAGTTLSNLPR